MTYIKEKSAARQFWEDQMNKHPNLYGVLCILGSLFGYLFNGHFIVDLGHWVVMTSGRIAETAMLFATLWVTAVNVAPELTAKLGSDLEAFLSSLSLVAFSLLPEVILFSAILTTYAHWVAVFQSDKGQRAAACTWAILYTLPTATFFVMTIYTIGSFIQTAGHVEHTAGAALVVRCLSGWFYSLIELISAVLSRQTRPSPLPDTQPQSEMDQEQITRNILSHLMPQFQELHQQREMLSKRLQQIEQQMFSQGDMREDKKEIDMSEQASTDLSPFGYTKAERQVSSFASEKKQEMGSFQRHEPTPDKTPEMNIPNVTQMSSPASTVKHLKVSAKASPKDQRGQASKRAARIFKKNPEIGPTELASRAGISRSYAAKLLSQQST